jgi:hypothetical protein
MNPDEMSEEEKKIFEFTVKVFVEAISFKEAKKEMKAFVQDVDNLLYNGNYPIQVTYDEPSEESTSENG